MKRQHKSYDIPMKKWDAARLESEGKLMERFGLKNKRQIWKAQSMLRRFRASAKKLFSEEGKAAEKRKEELLGKLARFGLLPENAEIDDVLPITVDQLLARQLQFIVKSKGLATTPKQARQLIVHGHIAVGERKVTRPSYLVSKEEETQVKYAPTSPISMPGHPIRALPKANLKSETEKALSEIREKRIAVEAKPGKEEAEKTAKAGKEEAKPKEKPAKEKEKKKSQPEKKAKTEKKEAKPVKKDVGEKEAKPKEKGDAETKGKAEEEEKKVEPVKEEAEKKEAKPKEKAKAEKGEKKAEKEAKK